jgi:hypothetical protein
MRDDEDEGEDEAEDEDVDEDTDEEGAVDDEDRLAAARDDTTRGGSMKTGFEAPASTHAAFFSASEVSCS